MDVAEVESGGVGVDFEHDAVFFGGLEDGFDVELSTGTFADEASGHVADAIDVRVFDGGEEAFGDEVGGLLEAEMDDGDDPVGLSQDFVGDVHRRVFEDVTFDAAEDFDVVVLLVDFADLLPLRQKAFFGEAVGHEDSFGVIGDGDVLEASAAGGFDHFFERRGAVGLGGVHVEVAEDIALSDELGDVAL